MTNAYMKRALALGWDGIRNQGLRPFAAVVVKDDTIIGEGISRSRCGHDVTAHGEIEAIRDASRRLDSRDLSGCEIYTTCEPCSLCVAAIWYSGISRIHYAYSLQQCEEIGVGTADLWAEVAAPIEKRRTAYERIMVSEVEELFEAWTRMPEFLP